MLLVDDDLMWREPGLTKDHGKSLKKIRRLLTLLGSNGFINHSGQIGV